jgi:hypothetical protein
VYYVQNGGPGNGYNKFQEVGRDENGIYGYWYNGNSYKECGIGGGSGDCHRPYDLENLPKCADGTSAIHGCYEPPSMCVGGTILNSGELWCPVDTSTSGGDEGGDESTEGSNLLQATNLGIDLSNLFGGAIGGPAAVNLLLGDNLGDDGDPVDPVDPGDDDDTNGENDPEDPDGDDDTNGEIDPENLDGGDGTGDGIEPVSPVDPEDDE